MSDTVSVTHGVNFDERLLGELLKSGILSQDLADELVQRSEGDAKEFERLLLQDGYLTDEELCQVKASMYDWRFINLNSVITEKDISKLLPRDFRESQKIVLFKRKDALGAAMADPANRRKLHFVQKKFGKKIKAYMATKSDIANELAKSDASFSKRFEAHIQEHLTAVQRGKTDEKSIIQLTNSILQHGSRSRASDVHIEPRKHFSYVRERVDGVLHTVLKMPIDVHALVVTRIKVLSKLATDEHARPQDGKLQFEDSEAKKIDVRVSLTPTTDGEKVVMRLLSSQDNALPLESIGMQGADLEAFKKGTSRSWGMVLVTGPTGSGKTTSLYAAVRRLHRDEVNIATIEDPVEYDLPGVNQIQVNNKVDVTFANGLRSILRQDPNIILVGEIRDKETAGIAINAAMTGHLVFSTLHTNDAATSVPRLRDMGVESFLIASTLNLIIAQRLVRTICVACRHSVELSAKDVKAAVEPEAYKKIMKGKKKVRLYEGAGCHVCRNTGYVGRTGLFEMLHVDQKIRDLIMKNATAEEIHKAAVKNGMTTMLDDGVEKALQGLTTLEEVLRVIRV